MRATELVNLQFYRIRDYINQRYFETFPTAMVQVTPENQRIFWWCKRNYERADKARSRQYIRKLKQQ